MRVLLVLLALAGCGDSTGCLYNPYDTAPQRSCATGVQLPGGFLNPAMDPSVSR